MLAWVAALAAQEAAADTTVSLDFYEAIDGWIAGMAMMSAGLVPEKGTLPAATSLARE